MIARSWTDYAPASAWDGQWIRRPQNAAESNFGEMGHDNSLQIQKKWTRLEPSIRFY